MNGDVDTTWEYQKENAAPLERGRDVKSLSEGSGVNLKSLEGEERRAFERTKRHYERLVKKTEHQDDQANVESKSNSHDDDPLVHWLSYIKFIQDACPSDTQASFLLMERCTRALVGVDRYKDDVRFLQVCIHYADRTTSPSDIFKFLHQKKVGSRTALFWAAWAWVAEKGTDYAFAEKIFKKGLSKGAKPKKMLEMRHRQFQRRMSKHWLKASSNRDSGTELDERDDEESRRGKLVPLSSGGLRHNDRSREINDENFNPNVMARRNASTRGRRGGSTRSQSVATRNSGSRSRPDTQRSQAPPPTGGAGFTIFVDENADDQAGYNLNTTIDGDSNNHRRRLATEAERKKENDAEAEQWNTRGGLDPSLPTFNERPSGPSYSRPAEETSAPAFQVFVDEEFAVEENKETSVEKKDTSEINNRSLRERRDCGMAEKLSRDPLRYVQNPEKYLKDKQTEDQKRRAQTMNRKNNTASSGQDSSAHLPTYHCGFDKNLLAKDEWGHEQCFEERRAAAQYFSLAPVSVNFSVLVPMPDNSEMSLTQDCTIDESVEMEEATIELPQGDMEEDAPLEVQKTSEKLRTTRRVLFSENIQTINDSISSQAGVDASCASSTVNERDAVGVAGMPEEETINTKFARCELSLMFSSPGANVETGQKSTNQKSTKLSFLHSGRTGEQLSTQDGNNDGNYDQGDNADIADSETATFSVMADLMKDDLSQVDNSITAAPGVLQLHNPSKVGCNSAKRGDDRPPVLPEKDNSPIAGNAPSAGGFTIFCDFDEVEEQEQSIGRKGTAVGKDSRAHSSAESAKASPRLNTSTCSIQESTNGEHEPDNGDTASFSLFDDAVKGLGEREPPEFGLPASSCKFEIFCDGDDNSECPEKHQLGRITATDDAGFLPTVDSENRDVLTGPRFGDISRIAPDEIDAPGSAKKRSRLSAREKTRIQSPPSRRKNRIRDDAVDYSLTHERDQELAKLEVLKNSQLGTSDSSLYSTRSRRKRGKTPEVEQPASFMPRHLKQRNLPVGTEITLNDSIAIVEHELGRGANGAVFLCKVKERDESDDTVAVKIQSPTGCLAWEFSVLKRIETRLAGRQRETGLFFPRAMSFKAFQDGAILGMTAASNSGVNLVDVVNAHKRFGGGPVPELIAMHYTVRMLLVLEYLHKKGNILHCDVKPDNWVLAESKSDGNPKLECKDLMLVDFGRAVDLTTVEVSQPLQAKFMGKAAAEDMDCVAMREGRPWSVDADTYGLCASSYVLLYGTHMDVVQDSSNDRWRPRKPLRRYWNKELWNGLFDSLLNAVDADVGEEGPIQLASLRKCFEKYLNEGSRRRELAVLLKQQATFLKKKKFIYD